MEVKSPSRRVPRLNWIGCTALAAGCWLSLASWGAAETRTSGVLAEGTPWATEYLVKDSGVAGPTVMIVAGVHGNEPAGYRAAEQIRHWPITRGKLIVLPRANVPALQAGRRKTPGVAHATANLNRNFAAAAKLTSGRGEMARALWKLVCDQQPDWLLDLHEGFSFKQINPKSVGSSIIVHPSEDARQVAPLMLQAVNETIADEAKKFVLLGPPINTSLSRAAGEHLGLNTMILETTKSDQPLSYRNRQHRIMVHRCLAHLEMLDPSVTVEWVTDQADSFADRRLALYDAEGSHGTGVPRLAKLLEDLPGLSLVRVGPEDIQGGALNQFDVLLLPGGSGRRQARALGEEGAARVREFVQAGGTYVGISGGAYLACEGFDWGLKLLNAKPVSPHWQRGSGMVTIELTPLGGKVFHQEPKRIDVHYRNGPILTKGDATDLPEYQTLARFRTELAENNAPQGIMLGAPAVISARYGEGRVLIMSPQPERTDGLDQFLQAAVEWEDKVR